MVVRGGVSEKTGSRGVPASHGGSGDGEGEKGTRWIGTPTEADAELAVVQDGADGARKVACVGATDGAGSAACVVARGHLRRRRRLGRPTHEELAQESQLLVDSSDGGTVVEKHPRHLELVEGAGERGRRAWRRVEPARRGGLHGRRGGDRRRRGDDERH
jgi:hypothetical protein